MDKTKPVLITGCSTGIGRATALRLNADGWKVVATARKPESIADLASAGCQTLALDVTDDSSMEAAVSQIEAEHGSVGALINNAGYSQSGAVESVLLDEARAQFETNVFGLSRLSQLVLPGMRKAGAGRIINISSMGGKLVIPGGGWYHATKHAVEALSDAMRFEVAPFGVDVVIIEPGAIKTEFGETAVSAMEKNDDSGPYTSFNRAMGQATLDAYEKGPLKLLGGEPDDVAKKIEKALKARKPKPRYKVTASAHMFMGTRRLMSDRMWDRFIGTQIPKPGQDS
jgi:NAD(P)-dependent dehydrogenase (short-subunit alcohol dehydrogenase family)